jgi:flagellin FlaB
LDNFGKAEGAFLKAVERHRHRKVSLRTKAGKEFAIPTRMKEPKDESGITALETAVIVTAFVVVAAVFGSTILSAGTPSIERGREAAYAGLPQIRPAIELQGGVVVTSSTAGASATVGNVIFAVSSVGDAAINLTDTTSADNAVVIAYRDEKVYRERLDWTLNWIVRQDGDTDDLLETGELAQITVDLASNGVTLGTDSQFVLELKPPDGAAMSIQRTTPAYLNLANDLQ